MNIAPVMAGDLLALLDHARSDLETQLAELAQAGSMNMAAGVVPQIRSRLVALNFIRDRLSAGASPTTLRDDVQAAVAAARAEAAEARDTVMAAQSARAASAPGLLRAIAEARQTVLDANEDIFERKIFDPYLRFASAEDEAAYRKREAERKGEIDRAMAEKSPGGTLRATDLTIEQLRDAGAHGADRSPDFAPSMQRLRQARDALAIGLGSAEKLQTTQPIASQPVRPDPTVRPPDDVIASLAAAGVVIADQAQDGHGVSATTSPSGRGRTVG